MSQLTQEIQKSTQPGDKQKFEQFCKDCNDQLSTVRTQLSKTKRELKNCREELAKLRAESEDIKPPPSPTKPKKTKAKSTAWVTPETRALATDIAKSVYETETPTPVQINQYLRIAYEEITKKPPPLPKPKSKCVTHLNEDECKSNGCTWIKEAKKMIDDKEHPGSKKKITVPAHCVMSRKIERTQVSPDLVKKLLKERTKLKQSGSTKSESDVKSSDDGDDDHHGESEEL